MTLRGLLAGVVIGLAGCGGLKSTLPAVTPAVAVLGVPTPAATRAGLDAELVRLQRELERRLIGRGWGVPVQLSRGAEPVIRVRLGADESFAGGSAQLEARALLLYAEIAEVLKASPGVVTHVIVHGDAPTSAEPWTDLSARRAASAREYLIGRGVPDTRLRAEGRGAGEPATVEIGAEAVNRRVELVLKLVIAGSEAEAWMPPASTNCQPCATDE